MSGPETVVVTDDDEFVEHLRPGDILLFDKLTSLNRLVQWGDNRPVGHCGVWDASGVYEATIKPQVGGGTRGGVFHTPFDELLGLRAVDDRSDVALVRTVTAVRHGGLSRARLERAVAFLRARIDNAQFGFRDMVLLAPFALERSQAFDDGWRKDLLDRIIWLAQRSPQLSKGGPDRFFCSELVYRAYAAAGLLIDIPDSLFARYMARRQTGGRRGSLETGIGLERGVGDFDPGRSLAAYEEFFERVVLSDVPVATDNIGTYERLPLDWKRTPPEPADMVTPGDYWSSPDLRPVAVLHRLPRR